MRLSKRMLKTTGHVQIQEDAAQSAEGAGQCSCKDGL